MKKLFFVYIAIILSSSVFAQSDTINKNISPPDFNNSSKDKLNKLYNEDGTVPVQDTSTIKKDNVINNPNSDIKETGDKNKNLEAIDKTSPYVIMMTNGKVMMMKGGKMTLIKKEITMRNGTKVLSNGTIIKKDGSTAIMKEGEHMGLNGTLIPLNNSKMPKHLPPVK